MARSIMGSIKHFAPFAAIIGYVAMYYTGSKGINQMLPDLQSISIDRLMQNYQNLVMAAAAGAGLYLIRHIRLPTALKDLIVVVLWFIIGYQIAVAVDPAMPLTYSGAVQYVPPAQFNPYALTGGAA
jgi:hypothetical protein